MRPKPLPSTRQWASGAALASSLMTPTAWAEDALTVGVAATGRSGGAGHESAGGRLDARYRFENSISLGLAVEGTALDHLFIGGFAERSGAGAGATLSASFPMLHMGPLSLSPWNSG